MITYEVKVDSNGSKYWYLDGQLHREDGPAIESGYGSKYWYLDGQLHREDGPAIESDDGSKYWYLNGQKHSEKQFNKKMNKPTELTMSELNNLLGYAVKIVE